MGEELEGWGATDAPLDGYGSEGELDTRKLIASNNKKKKKKSGGFQSLGLSAPVLRGVLKKGYKVPTPIQRKTLPVILEGKDVVAMARTGSGKTASFLIPLFEKLRCHSVRTGARAVILSPTRELALQTLKFTKDLGKYSGLRAAVVVGGDSLEGQFAALHQNPDVIIATPGRLVHVCVEMNLKLDTVEYVVFDEADRLFEMGFSEQLNEILRRLPEIRQTVLFSATLPKMLVEFARAGLNDPVLIRLDAEHVLSENLRLAFFKVNTEDKVALLLHLLQHLIREEEQTVIFAATKHHVEYLHTALDHAHIPNTYCYSSLDPTARKINIAKFQTKKVRCFLVTDVAARGIDIPLLDNVVNFNFPGKPKLFVHRVGRVARAGRSGVAYSFIAPDEAAYLFDLHLFLNKELRFAPHPPDERHREEWNFMYGSVPQTILDNVAEQVIEMHNTSSDLDKLKSSSVNAYKQYSKCRTAPSAESVRRMKEQERVGVMGYHPILAGETPALEQQRIAMLHSLKTLQPKGTVFEMFKTRKECHMRAVAGMKEKREYDGKRIETYHKSIEARQAAREEKEAKSKQATEQVGKLEQCTEEEVKHAFSTIVGLQQEEKEKEAVTDSLKTKGVKRKTLGESTNSKKKKKKKLKNKENQSFKDKEFFIPYTNNNEFSDAGFSVGGSFNRVAEAAALDLTADEDVSQRKSSTLHKWDRYKKKFVGTQNQQKRIKTESGVWIPASYKTDRYQKWMGRTKTKDVVDSDGEEVQQQDQGQDQGQESSRNNHFQVIRKMSSGKTHPLLQGQKNQHRPPKRELRTEDEIRKEMKRKEGERKKHMEGFAKSRAKMTSTKKRELAAAKRERSKMQSKQMRKMGSGGRGSKGKRRK